MIVLDSGQVLSGKAGTASAIVFTAFKDDKISVATNTYVPIQGVLGTGATTMVTAPGSPGQTLVKTILLANNSGSDVTGVTFFVLGTATTNQISGTMTIPANGSASYSDGEWHVYSASGLLLTTIGGAAGGDLSGSYPNPTINNDAVTNAKLFNVPTATFKGRISASTGDPEDLTMTQATSMLNVATTALAGTQSALDKKKEDNLYYDVTANSIATLVGDDSTDNLSAWNTLFAALPVGATVFFPVGTFRFSGDININADKHLRIKGAGKYSTIIKTTSATANGFSINGVQAWYNTFEDLRFETTANKTAGAAILISTVGLSSSAQQVGINIYRCSFSNWFKAVYCNSDNVGQGPGNLSVWDSLDISIPGTTGSPNARGIHINGGGTNLVCSNSTINLGFPPFQVSGTACIEINQSGAIQLLGGEFIGGTNTILMNANQGGTSSIAAVYATNCFFDQSAGSTFKITGGNVTNRCKFVQCGITGGNVAGATAVEIASTGTGAAGTATAAADGINFIDCDIYPNGGSGTMNGFLITGAQGVSIQSSRISGWTNGVQITPAAAAGYTKLFMSDNKMGATNNFTTPNTVGALLNVGSFQYGSIYISGNDFTGSTTPISDASTIGPTGYKYIGDNPGVSTPGSLPALASGGATLLANNGRGAVTSGLTETFLATFRIPANGVLVGDIIQITALVQSSSTGTFAPHIRAGAAGTIADALFNVTGTSAAGAVNSFQIINIYVYVVALGSTATVAACIEGTSTAAAFANATGAEVVGNVVTTAAWFLTFTGTASAGTYTVKVLRARFV